MGIYDILSILGGVAFLLAGYLTYLQIQDYYCPLHLIITYLDCQPTGNETSLVLYRLSFVNHSSRGRVVYDIDVTSKVPGISQIELREEVDQNLHSVTYSLPNVYRQLPLDETLLFPLDIPPNQSLSRWKAIAVSYHDIPHGIGTHICFDATAPVGIGKWKRTEGYRWDYMGIKKRVLARAELVLFPAEPQSRTRNIYHEL
jgi:hypothetical protein